MNKRFLISTLALCLILVVMLAGVTNATKRYAVTILGPGSGESVNDSGYVTGHIDVVQGEISYDHVFLYDGTTHDLETNTQNSCGFGISSIGVIAGTSDQGALLYNGGTTTYAPGYIGRDINENGVIVGYTTGGKGAVCQGVWAEIPGLDGVCQSINSNDQITGFYMVGENEEHAFLYDGSIHDLSILPGFTRSRGCGINAAGKIIGFSDVGDLTSGHVMLYDGTLKDLGVLPGNDWGGGLAINDSDSIVGMCIDSNGDETAFLHDGTMRDLNTLIDPEAGIWLMEAHDINNSGFITGVGNANGVLTAYLLTPIEVPELTIGEPSAATTSSGPITFTVTYSNANTITLQTSDITLNKTGTANGTVSVSGSDNTTRTVTISDITGNGTLGISIGDGTASNDEGLAVSAGPSATFAVENVPDVQISAPSAGSATTGPITYTITYTGATAVTLSTADISLNHTGTANGDVSVSGEGTATRTVTISNIVGYGWIGISLAAGTASNAIGPALAAGPSANCLANNLPSVDISEPSVASATSGPVTYTITYGGAAAVNLTIAKITLNKTGTANGTVSVTGSGTASRTVTISNIIGSGTLGISIAAGSATNTKGAALAAGPSSTFSVANPPSITISAPSATQTQTTPVTYTITYTGATAVTLTNANVTLNKTGSANGTVAVTGAGTATRTVTISGVTGSGTLGITLAAGTASNATGSSLGAGPSATFGVYNGLPRAIIGAPSVTETKSGPVRYTITYVNAAAVTLTAANVTLVKTGTANGTVAVTGTGTTIRTVTISNTTGDGTLAIRLAAGTASNFLGSAALAGPSATFKVVNTPPRVTIGAPSIAATKSGPVTYTVTYTGAKSVTLTAAKVVLNKTGTANGTVSVSGTGLTTRTVTISSTTGDGTLSISLLAGTASNTGGSSLAAGPSTAFTVANTWPKVKISSPSVTETKAGPVTYTITYTGATAVNLTTAKVVLNKTGTATGTVTVTGTGTATRTVTISAISGDGTLGISILSASATNPAGAAPAAGPSTTFTVVNTPPRIIVGAPSVTTTRAGPLTYRISYVGAKTVTLTTAKIVLNKTGTAKGTVSVTGTGTLLRTVTISNITGDGTLGISILAGTASNTAGSAPAAGPSTTCKVINTRPTITISQPSPTATKIGPVSYTVTYTNATAVTLTAAKVTLAKTGTANGVVTVTGTGLTTRTIRLSSITGNGTLKVSIASGTATNIAGYALAAGPSAAVTVTSTVPKITIGSPSSLYATSGYGSTDTVSYTITYTGAASISLTAAKITLNKTGDANGTVTVTGTGTATRTVTVSNLTGDGTLGISIAAGSATNVVGSAAAAGPSLVFAVQNFLEPPPPP